MAEIRSIDDIIAAVESAEPATRQRLVAVLLPLDTGIEEDETLTFEQRTNRSFGIMSRLVATQAGNIEALTAAIETQGRQLREEIAAQGKNIETQGRQLREEIAAQGKNIETQGRQLREEIAAQGKNIELLTATTAAQGKQLGRDIDGLGNTVRNELQAQSSFRGNYAQTAAQKAARDIAALFAPRHGLNPNLLGLRYLSWRDLEELVDKNIRALEALSLKRDGALRSFINPDIVAEVRDRRVGPNAPVAYHIIVEASYTVDEDDYDRVIDNATIVRRTTESMAYPVVAGVLLDGGLDDTRRAKIHEDIDKVRKSGDPDAAYWYRLNSADLRPPELS